MLSDTLPWNRLPARRQSAAADGRLVEALFELLTKVRSTDRHQEKVPANVARDISRPGSPVPLKKIRQPS